MFKSLTVFSIFLLFILNIGIVSASENIIQTDNFDILTNKNIDNVKISKENSKQIVDSKHLNNKKTNKLSANKSKQKTQVIIKTKNFKTYFESDRFFTAKILNKTNKKPIKGLKVLFSIYSNKNKHTNYHKITNKNGTATLNKNLKIGNYTVYTTVKNKNIINQKTKAKIKIKPIINGDCCSYYIHLNSTESVGGFRRDDIYNVDVLLKPQKWYYNKKIIKHYKSSGSYYFHLIITSDGWMIGNGGLDSAKSNKDIEKIASKMIRSNKITMSYLKKIMNYKKYSERGHFAIKAPDGRFGIVWRKVIKTGKLKNGEFICVPNKVRHFRRGNYKKFSKDPAKAAILLGATDKYGVNKRQCISFYLKNFKTHPKVTVYAANDNGRLSGRRTAHLRDNIIFKNKLISKYKLPMTPKMKYIGTHNFGSNLIKIKSKY